MHFRNGQESTAIENSVDAALRQQYVADPLRFPCKGLKKRERGRCTARELVKRPVPQLTRPGRQGDFNTDCEVLSNLARMKTRQTRRAESLLRSIRSSNNAPMSAAKQTQLLQEWKAIKAARGYQGPFPQWVLSVAHFHTFPCGLPTIDWLEDLVAYLKFDASSLAQDEASCRRKHFKHQLQLDAKYASARQGYAAVRGPAHPPFTEVPAHRQAQVNWVEDQGPEQAWYACLDCPCPAWRLPLPSLR